MPFNSCRSTGRRRYSATPPDLVPCSLLRSSSVSCFPAPSQLSSSICSLVFLCLDRFPALKHGTDVPRSKVGGDFGGRQGYRPRSSLLGFTPLLHTRTQLLQSRVQLANKSRITWVLLCSLFCCIIDVSVIRAFYSPDDWSSTNPQPGGPGFELGVFLPLDRLCLLYTSPSPRDRQKSRMPSSA